MLEITYPNVFWLFMIGNVLGVLIEGVWCLLMYRRWETHVVTLWGPFNLVYGLGITVFYVCRALVDNFNRVFRVIVLGLSAALVEYLCGLLIRAGIRMKAWDYRKHFLNIQGLISLKMTVIWTALGLGFDLFYPYVQILTSFMSGKAWNIACVLLTVFMVINILWTAVCIIRWAFRHQGKKAKSGIVRFIDRRYPDNWMQRKFCNWSFIEDATA